MKIKKKLKNLSIVKRIAYFKNKRNSDKRIKDNIENYKRDYLKYSTDLSGNYDERSRRRLIIIETHIIEKGLSHTDFRPGFGRQNVIDLQDNIIAYLKEKNLDKFAVINAISILYLYHKMNVEHGFWDEDYVNMKLFEDREIQTLVPYDLDIQNSFAVEECENIFYKRHSVRLYDDDGDEVDNQLLLKAVELANTAPSACNRQATHIFAVKNKDLFEKIETLHGGCKGFGRHVSLFLFVTSDLSLYSSNEIKLPIYDAGIYTMNLLYALQAYELYACPLNASLPGKSDQMHHLTGIPNNYDINGLIAVYKIKSENHCRIAASPRRNAKEVLSIIK